MESIFSILSAVPDYRKGNHLVYPLDYILLVSFTALMSGYKTWRQFELYAQQHKDDLRREYTKYARRELDGYTPSHDTFSYVFGGLEPKAFRKAFTDWITAVFELAGQHICIDGKTMRGVKKLEADGLFKPFYKKEIVRTMSEEYSHGRVEKRVMESIMDPMRLSDIGHYIS